ncbi:MAG: aldo/keto reductase [Eubacteriales bacterium]
MIYREMGKTGVKVSQLGFGCMRFPVLDGDNAKIDEVKATEMIEYAIAGGVNYFDTAFVYHTAGAGQGQSEFFTGKALKPYRDQVNIATKLPSWLINTPADNMKYLDMQLKALDTDTIDFYLLHALGRDSYDNLKKNDIFKFIDEAKRLGKIKHIGFSFHAPYDEFDYIINDYDWEFSQIQYNILDTDYQAGAKGLKQIADKNAGVVIMEPLRGGTLTDMVKPARDLLAQQSETRTMADWALSWLFDQPSISTVLSGMSTLEQVKENIEIASRVEANSLSPAEREALTQAAGIVKGSIKVPCTACQYCMPCPQGVNIPDNFSRYNSYFYYDEQSEARETIKFSYYNFFNEAEWAEQCISCGICEEHCPQQIKISERMPEVAELFKK